MTAWANKIRVDLLLNVSEAAQALCDALTTEFCPYLRGEGACVTGCWTEPQCITNGPPPVLNSARWVQDEARHAELGLTGHGDVKHVRDVRRWAQKIEVKAL